MKPRWIVVLAVCALLVVGIAVYAMPPGLINPPAQPPAWRVGPENVKLKVVCDPRIKVPRLTVPRSLLVTSDQPKRLGAATLVPTVVTSLALSAALVIGGLWFAGRGNRPAAAALVLLGVVILGAGAVLANAPAPPPLLPPFPPEGPQPPAVAPAAVTLPAEIKLSPDVVLEVVESGDCLVLTVPDKPRPVPDKEKPTPAKDEVEFPAVPVVPGKAANPPARP